MRKLLFTAPWLVLLALGIGCQSKTPAGPGTVKITETTTSTTTSTTTTTTTSTIPLPSVAVFRFSPVTPEVGQAVNFTSAGSTPQMGRKFLEYLWDFGDGTTSEGPTATHTYGAPGGVFIVTLTIEDDQGDHTSSVQIINVRPKT